MVSQKIALIREKFLENTTECTLYNGWPCLTCLRESISSGFFPQNFWEINFPEWWINNPEGGWDIIYNQYAELTENYPMMGYITQKEWLEIVKKNNKNWKEEAE